MPRVEELPSYDELMGATPPATPKPRLPRPRASIDQYSDLIDRYASKHGVDPELVRRVMGAESSGKARAVSPKGAQGLMQIIPDTQRYLSRKYGLDFSDPYNLDSQIEGGTLYLKEQLDEFKDPALAVAAYNAGPGAVRKYGGIPPYRETRDYANKITRGYAPKASRPGTPSDLPSFDELMGPGESSQGEGSPEALPSYDELMATPAPTTETKSLPRPTPQPRQVSIGANDLRWHLDMTPDEFSKLPKETQNKAILRVAELVESDEERKRALAVDGKQLTPPTEAVRERVRQSLGIKPAPRPARNPQGPPPYTDYLKTLYRVENGLGEFGKLSQEQRANLRSEVLAQMRSAFPESPLVTDALSRAEQDLRFQAATPAPAELVPQQGAGPATSESSIVHRAIESLPGTGPLLKQLGVSGFLAHHYNQAAKGATEVVPAAVDLLSVAGQAIQSVMESGASDPELKSHLQKERPTLDQVSKALRNVQEKAFPDDPRWRGSLSGDVARGLGQVVPMVVPFFGPWASGSRLLLPALMGASLGSSELYNEAKQQGADENQAVIAGLAGAGIGLSELIPLAAVFKRADRLTGGEFSKQASQALARRIAKGMLTGGATDMFQEVGQTEAGKLVIAEILNKDPKLFDEETWRSGVVGGAVGLLTGGLGGVSHGPRTVDSSTTEQAPPAEAVSASQPAPEPQSEPIQVEQKVRQQYHHRDFGLVTETDNQWGVAKGYVRVIDQEGKPHTIRKPDGTGAGNQLAVPVRTTAEGGEADVTQGIYEDARQAQEGGYVGQGGEVQGGENLQREAQRQPGDEQAARQEEVAAAVPTVPEAPETIEAQMEAMQAGRRPAVLITDGENMPAIPKGFAAVSTDAGTFIYDPAKTNATDIQQRVANNTYHELLGHVEPKGPTTTQTVVARNPATGQEIQSSVVSPENVPAQTERLQQQYPEATVEAGGEETAAGVIAERAGAPPATTTPTTPATTTPATTTTTQPPVPFVRNAAEFRQKIAKDLYGLSDTEADAITTIVDAVDRWYSRLHGKERGSWFSDRIAGAERGATSVGGKLTQGNQGAVHPLRDGRFIIHALEGGNVSTVAHEVAHIFHYDLTPELQAVTERWLGKPEGKNGRWSEPQAEKFARAFEKYLRTGEAPSIKLKEVFEQFKSWLTEIYTNISRKGSPLYAKLSPEAIEVFDTILGVNKGEHGKFASLLYQRPPDAPHSFLLHPDVRRALGLKVLPPDASKDERSAAYRQSQDGLIVATGVERETHLSPDVVESWARRNDLPEDAISALRWAREGAVGSKAGNAPETAPEIATDQETAPPEEEVEEPSNISPELASMIEDERNAKVFAALYDPKRDFDRSAALFRKAARDHGVPQEEVDHFVEDARVARTESEEGEATQLGEPRALYQARRDKKVHLATVAPDAIADPATTPIKELRQAALKYAIDNYKNKTFKNDDTDWEIIINKVGVKKTLQHAAKVEQIQSIAALPDLLKNAVRGYSERPRDPAEATSIKFYHTFFAPLDLDGTLYRVKLTVREMADGKRFYDHDLTQIERPADSPLYPSRSKTGGLGKRTAGSDISLDDLLKGVKWPTGPDVLFQRSEQPQAGQQDGGGEEPLFQAAPTPQELARQLAERRGKKKPAAEKAPRPTGPPQGPKEGRRKILDEINRLGADADPLVRRGAAELLRTDIDLEDWRAHMRVDNPDLSDQDLDRIYKESFELHKSASDEARRTGQLTRAEGQLPPVPEDRDLTPDEAKSRLEELERKVAEMQEQQKERERRRREFAKEYRRLSPQQKRDAIREEIESSDEDPNTIEGALLIMDPEMEPIRWRREMRSRFPDHTTDQLKEEYRRAYALYKQTVDSLRQAREEASIRRQEPDLTDEELRTLKEQRAETRAERQRNRSKLQAAYAALEKGELTRWGRFKENVKDIANAPRSLVSSIDLSAAGRQAAMFSVTHPIEAAKIFFGKQLRSFKDQGYEDFIRSLENDPDLDKMRDGELYLATLADDSINNREELFASKLTAKISPVRKSEQAYKTFLDAARVSWFKQLTQVAEDKASADGRTLTKDDYRAIAKFINRATGRGDLGKGAIADAAPVLSAIFFAPRYTVSKIQVFDPRMYYRMPPGARGTAMRQAATHFAAMATVALLLKYGLGLAVGLEPEESDFMKLRVGDTRYDLTAGHGQYAILAARLVRNAINQSTGDQPKVGKDVVSNLKRFARYKLAPIPGAAVNIATGKNPVGEDVTTAGELGRLVTPIFAGELVEAFQKEGLLGVAKTSPSVVGVGVNTYSDRPQRQSTRSSRSSRSSRERPRRAER